MSVAGTPNAVGAALNEIKALTGWSWGAVASHVGMTETYARKLGAGVGKFGTAGAGRSHAANVEAFRASGEAQEPVQRSQRVRAPRGQESRPAARRARVVTPREPYAGGKGGRWGWQQTVTIPHPADRPAADVDIAKAVRAAAQGHRRIGFIVADRHGGRPLELYGGKREREGRFASGAGHRSVGLLSDMRKAGGATEWLAGAFAEHITYTENVFEDADDIGAVTIVALP